MTAGELVLVVAAVLCTLGFAAVVVTLVRLRDSAAELSREVVALRQANLDLAEVVTEARSDLDRFDELLGSASAISRTIGRSSAATSKIAYSAPAIKAAGIVTGTSRAARRLRSGT